MYGILMIQEKIRQSSPTSNWVADEDLVEGLPTLAADTVNLITAPFGNSTTQNRSSGLLSTGAVMRPSDRLP